MNMNYTSDLHTQCGQANSVTPFCQSFVSDIKTKEQVAVRTITRTQNFVHVCSQPNNHVFVLQPLLIIFNFLCSLKSGKHVCNADYWHIPTARASM